LLLSTLCAVLSLLTDLALLRGRHGRSRAIELLALRHEVRVLRRQVKRTAWRPGDRFVLALVSQRRPRAAWGVLPVRPETLLRWHRELVRRKWAAFGRSRGPGRPPLPPDVRDLIERLAAEDPMSGYQRILREYAEHDNAARPHRSRQLRTPDPRDQPGSTVGEVVRRDRLGGLVHEYQRRAARVRRHIRTPQASRPHRELPLG
jgi:hypothetical protein